MTVPIYIDKITQVFESRGNLHIKGACSTGGVDARGVDIGAECLHVVIPLEEALVALPRIANSLPSLEQISDRVTPPFESAGDGQDTNHVSGEFSGEPLSFKLVST